MSDVIAAFRWGKELECQPDKRRDVVEAARPRRSQERFEFRERELDRVEVRTVRGQQLQSRADRLNRRANGRLLVRRQIIEDHHVAAVQGRREDLFNVCEQTRAIDRVIEDRGCRQAVEAQRGDHGVDLPLAAGRVIGESRAARTAPVPPDQIGRDAAFIEKHVVRDVPQRLPVAPLTTRRDDIRTALFVGVYGFF